MGFIRVGILWPWPLPGVPWSGTHAGSLYPWQSLPAAGLPSLCSKSPFSLQLNPDGILSNKACHWILWHWTHISTTLDQAKRARNHWKNLDLIGLSQKDSIPSKSTTSRYPELHPPNADGFSWNKVERCILRAWLHVSTTWNHVKHAENEP